MNFQSFIVTYLIARYPKMMFVGVTRVVAILLPIFWYFQYQEAIEYCTPNPDPDWLRLCNATPMFDVFELYYLAGFVWFWWAIFSGIGLFICRKRMTEEPGFFAQREYLTVIYYYPAWIIFILWMFL